MTSLGPKTPTQDTFPSPLPNGGPRSRVLTIAANFMAKHGFDAWDLDDIAKAAGMGLDEVLALFPTREALASASYSLADARRRAAHFSGDSARGWEGLDAWVSLMKDVEKLPGAFKRYSVARTHADEPNHPDHDWISYHRHNSLGMVTFALETGIEDGVMSLDVPVETTAQMLLSVVDGTQLHWLSSPGTISVSGIVAEFVQLLRSRYEITPSA